MTRTHRLPWKSFLFFLSFLSLSCSGNDQSSPGDLEGSQGALTVKLYWEGTCNYLACCSCYRKEYDEQLSGTYTCAGIKCNEAPKCGPADPDKFYAPSFGCKENDLACSDQEKWLVLPRLNGQCGKKYLVCYKGNSVEVTVKDKSDKNMLYEASSGVFTALGLKPGENPEVKIYINPEDPAIVNDKACGCSCGPACFHPKSCRCVPDGACTTGGQPGIDQSVCWANGVKSVQSGMTTTVTKDEELCFTADSTISQQGGLVSTFYDPNGDLIGKMYLDLFDRTKVTLECDGKKYTIDMKDPACQKAFNTYDNPVECTQGGCEP